MSKPILNEKSRIYWQDRIELHDKKIEKDTDRDYIMTPEEALEYGMIDKVVTVNTTPKPNQEI